MELNGIISSVDTVANTLGAVVNVLIFIAKFLFLTPWGWILIVIAFISIILVKIRTKKDKITFYSFIGGFTETLFWFYSNIAVVLIGVLLIFSVSLLFKGFDDFSESLKLFREVKMLEAALKNLETDRKIIEAVVEPVVFEGQDRMNVTVRYFSYSPVKEDDILTGEKVYTVDGRRLYVDFGVINFKYSLIEEGEAINLAFPNKIYSESVAYEDGKSILGADKTIPLSYKLGDEDIFTISEDEYNAQLAKIFSSATNAAEARKMGIRTTYGQALTITPVAGRTYRFYSTGTGGMVLR
jgi:hypothetical protein